MIEINVTGTAALIRRAEKAPANVQRAVSQEIERTALKIHRRAKQGAPVDTGYLRNSINNQRMGILSQKVQARAEYAGHVNFGTRRQKKQPFFSGAVDEGTRGFESRLRVALRGKI